MDEFFLLRIGWVITVVGDARLQTRAKTPTTALLFVQANVIIKEVEDLQGQKNFMIMDIHEALFDYYDLSKIDLKVANLDKIFLWNIISVLLDWVI